MLFTDERLRFRTGEELELEEQIPWSNEKKELSRETVYLYCSIMSLPRYLILILVLAPGLFMARLNAANPPNIVFIFSDDQGMNDIGCYGSEIPTPHIDSIAKNGMKFESFYVTTGLHAVTICPAHRSLPQSGTRRSSPRVDVSRSAR